MKYSDRSKRNMTNQMLAQLEFLEKNLEKKQKRLERSYRWKKYRLPGLGLMIKRQENGIKKVKADIIDMNSKITKLQKEDKIFNII